MESCNCLFTLRNYQLPKLISKSNIWIDLIWVLRLPVQVFNITLIDMKILNIFTAFCGNFFNSKHFRAPNLCQHFNWIRTLNSTVKRNKDFLPNNLSTHHLILGSFRFEYESINSLSSSLCHNTSLKQQLIQRENDCTSLQ